MNTNPKQLINTIKIKMSRLQAEIASHKNRLREKEIKLRHYAEMIDMIKDIYGDIESDEVVHINGKSGYSNITSLTKAVKMFFADNPYDWFSISMVTNGIAEHGFKQNGKHRQASVNSVLRRLEGKYIELDPSSSPKKYRLIQERICI